MSWHTREVSASSDASDAVSAATTMRLAELWRRHVAAGTDSLDRLLARHCEKHRHYHTVDHVASVVGRVDELAQTETTGDIGAVMAAAFYHDAVYEPVSPANERASARLARRDLSALGWDPDRADRVAAMIEATATHTSPADSDHAVLFDADLSILAAAPSRYDDYVRSVRAEYRHVDDDAWNVGRRRVLEGFLDREEIFATPTGRDRWESAARDNLRAELDSLRD